MVVLFGERMITINMLPFKNALRQTGGGKFADLLKDSVQTDNITFSDYGISRLTLKSDPLNLQLLRGPLDLSSFGSYDYLVTPLDLKTLFEEIYPAFILGHPGSVYLGYQTPWLAFGADGTYHITTLNSYTIGIETVSGSKWSFYLNDWVAVKLLSPIKEIINPTDFQKAQASTGNQSGASVFAGNLRTAFLVTFAALSAGAAYEAYAAPTAVTPEAVAPGFTDGLSYTGNPLLASPETSFIPEIAPTAYGAPILGTEAASGAGILSQAGSMLESQAVKAGSAALIKSGEKALLGVGAAPGENTPVQPPPVVKAGLSKGAKVGLAAGAGVIAYTAFM